MQHLVTGESEFHDNLETAELESLIKSALQRLPAKCREIFELSRFEGRKYAEIAELLHISVKTVEAQMSKALHSMKENLKDYLTLLLLLLIRNMHQ
jgi:RNA polymerase sigma-70 factor (ECF subfamily)